MTFKRIAVATSVIAFVLGVGYLVAGPLVMGRWQIQITDEVLLIGRRMGALYLGLSAMFFLARSSAATEARTALAIGTAIALFILVLLGLFELAAGRVGAGILLSMGIEAVLAGSYIWIALSDRRGREKHI